MKKIILAFLITLISLNAFSNTQLPDKIIYNGTKYSLDTYPLEDFFNRNPAMRPENIMPSPDLWRGYVATFEVLDNQLFLKNIEIREWNSDSITNVSNVTKWKSINNNIKFSQKPTKWKSVYNIIFPNQKKLKIDWLTDILVIPFGKKEINKTDYSITYRNYFLLEIYKGDLIGKKQFTNTEFEEFKDLQFEAYKKTNDYEKVKKEIIEEYKELIDPNTKTDQILDQYIRKSIMYYTTKFLT